MKSGFGDFNELKTLIKIDFSDWGERGKEERESVAGEKHLYHRNTEMVNMILPGDAVE